MSRLLISKGCYKGKEYLAHLPMEELLQKIIWKGYDPKEHQVIFVPFAEEEKNWNESAEKAGNFFKKNGFPFVSMHSPEYKESTFPGSSDRGILCIGEGNVFRLLKTIQEKNLFGQIKKLTNTKRGYIGIGAGCTICDSTIELTCDTPIVGLLDLTGFGINDCPIIPNFVLGSLTHSGIPIEQAAQKYFNETLNDVIGLPESCYVLKSPSCMYLDGIEDAAWFNDNKGEIAKWAAGENKWTAFSL